MSEPSSEPIKEKCNHCAEEAIMEVKNLKNQKSAKLCKAHFGEFITQGQSRVYEQFLNSMHARV
jgi:hypothetical protein